TKGLLVGVARTHDHFLESTVGLPHQQKTAACIPNDGADHVVRLGRKRRIVVGHSQCNHSACCQCHRHEYAIVVRERVGYRDHAPCHIGRGGEAGVVEHGAG